MVKILPLDKTFPWLSNTMPQYNRQFMGCDKFVSKIPKAWETDM